MRDHPLALEAGIDAVAHGVHGTGVLAAENMRRRDKARERSRTGTRPDIPGVVDDDGLDSNANLIRSWLRKGEVGELQHLGPTELPHHNRLHGGGGKAHAFVTPTGQGRCVR